MTQDEEYFDEIDDIFGEFEDEILDNYEEDEFDMEHEITTSLFDDTQDLEDSNYYEEP